MTALWYNGTRAMARFFVAVAGGTLLKAMEKYEPKWLLFTGIALVLATILFLVEQRLKHLLAD